MNNYGDPQNLVLIGVQNNNKMVYKRLKEVLKQQENKHKVKQGFLKNVFSPLVYASPLRMCTR